MGSITADQSQAIMATLQTNVPWSDMDFEALGLQDAILRDPKRAGAEFTAFLKNGAQMNLGPNILRIRSQPFNPATFIGQGWTIWRGPSDGDGLTGKEEQDDRSLDVTEIDLSKIQLVTMLKARDSVITGEEKLKRLKRAKHICLDAKVFQTLWENQDRIPEAWKERVNGNIQYVCFDGTVLRSPNGIRYVLYLYFLEGRWYWLCRWLGSGWDSGRPSAVLASI